MDTFEAIEARRAVKHYDPEFVMPEEDLQKILDAALLSPTSFNIQNWRFVVVRDADQKAKLRACSWDQEQVTHAAVTMLLCADLKSWDHEPERYWKNAPQETQDMLVPMIRKFYEPSEALQQDEAIRSIGIASQTIMLAAKSLGYDSCPMIGFDPTAVAEIINLPEDHVVGLMITIGKATKAAHPRGGQLDKSDVVVYDQF